MVYTFPRIVKRRLPNGKSQTMYCFPVDGKPRPILHVISKATAAGTQHHLPAGTRSAFKGHVEMIFEEVMKQYGDDEGFSRLNYRLSTLAEAAARGAEMKRKEEVKLHPP